jgi:hypothetical protein
MVKLTKENLNVQVKPVMQSTIPSNSTNISSNTTTPATTPTYTTADPNKYQSKIPTQNQSTYVKPTSLAQDIINTSKNDWKNVRKEWNDMFAKDEIRPQDAFEETL